MTQEEKGVKKEAEFNKLFLTLNDRAQDGALTILKSLAFAQSVMCSPKRMGEIADLNSASTK